MRQNHQGARAERLAAPAFLEKVRCNAIMQAHLGDLYVESLHNEHVRYHVIKEALVKLVLIKYNFNIEFSIFWCKSSTDSISYQIVLILQLFFNRFSL